MKKQISKVIAERIKTSGKRWNAADNISEFIKSGEKELLINELAGKFDSVIDSLVIDRENDPNSTGTGKRLAKMYIKEIMGGRYNPMDSITTFPNDGEHAYEGMLVVRAEIKSMCSHHHQPVQGVAYIGVLPGKKVMGLSKYIRIAQHYARRGQLQEELCTQIATAIMKHTETQHVGVYVQATHGCCENRGVMANNSLTQTTVLRGNFIYNAAVKEEFFNNIKLQQTRGC